MTTNNKASKPGINARRGVAVIVGGVILVAILLSTIFAFYVTVLKNDRAQSASEIQSQQDSREKAIEEFSVTRFIQNGKLKVNVTNTGGIPMSESHWALYCASCANPGIPLNMSAPLSLTLNPGNVDSYRQIGAVTTGNRYVIQVISERGNIVSTEECQVQGSSPNQQCVGGSGNLDLAIDGILRGNGPLQLDLKTFGAIFPDLGARGPVGQSIDQRGWDARVTSTYGNVTGYPGTHIPYNLNTVYTQRMRNVDPSGQNLILSRDTLISNIDGGRNVRLPIDVVFAIDSSGSMCGSPSPGNDPTGLRKTGAQAFVDKLDPLTDRGAVVSWDDNVDFTYGLSSDFVTLKTQIGNVDCGGGTDLNVGLNGAIARLDASVPANPTNRIIVFLTDGLGTYTSALSNGPAAIAQSKGYKTYTINLNAPTAIGPLSDMAYATDGGLYISPTAANLATIYDDIQKKALVASSIPDVNYICKEDKVNKLMLAYNEGANKKVVNAVASDASLYTGWTELFFCSRTPGSAVSDYKPTNSLTSYHPLVMIARGTFNNTLEESGSTMAYQSSSVSDDDAVTIFNSCLRTADVNTACASPSVADTAATLKYSATKATMQAGTNVWVHVNTVTSKVTVSWIYPDGTDKILNMTNNAPAKDQTLNANHNVPFAVKLPQKESDGTTNIGTTCAAGSFRYYTMKVTDEFDSEGRWNVYYMTFRMNC